MPTKFTIQEQQLAPAAHCTPVKSGIRIHSSRRLFCWLNSASAGCCCAPIPWRRLTIYFDCHWKLISRFLCMCGRQPVRARTHIEHRKRINRVLNWWKQLQRNANRPSLSLMSITRAAHQQLGTGRNLIYRRGIVRSRSSSTFFFRRQQSAHLACWIFFTNTRRRAPCMHEDCFIAHGCAHIRSCCHVSLNTCMAPRTHTKILRAQKMVFKCGPQQQQQYHARAHSALRWENVNYCPDCRHTAGAPPRMH